MFFLIFITSIQNLSLIPFNLVTSSSEQLFFTVEAALQGGLTLLQYREKTADDSERLSHAQKLRQMCHHYGALFIMNDRVDLALAVDADGVHLGQQDVPIALARQLLGPQRLIGRSTTNPDEMHRAIAEGADYIGVGPVYDTPTKADKDWSMCSMPLKMLRFPGLRSGELTQVTSTKFWVLVPSE